MALAQLYILKFWAYISSEILIWFWTRVFGSFVLGMVIFVFAYTQLMKTRRSGPPKAAGEEEWFIDHIVYEGAYYWVVLHMAFSVYRTYFLYSSAASIIGFTQLYYIPYGLIIAFQLFILAQLKQKSKINPQFLPEETYL